jgi:hypothetical protein
MPDRERIAPLWLAGAAVAGLATWMCYDSMPGLNWFIWTLAVVAGVVWLAPARRGPTMAACALAVILTGGAVISAFPFIWALIFMSTAVALAVAMLLSSELSFKRLTAGFTVAAPVLAVSNVAISSFKRAAEATTLVRSAKARAVVRGLAITLPVVAVFALLLAVADPTFALWRDTIRDLIADWEFLPRTAFFIVILGLMVGSYGYILAASGTSSSDLTPPGNSHRWLGSSERLMLLGAVTALLWLFLIVQLTYFFGNMPSISGSGVTFADYARRGFGELTIVATASALLIVGSERYGESDRRRGLLRALTYMLIIAVLLVLGSAFRRVILYEAAYGFTTPRLYAQAFMIVVGAGLLALALEVSRELNPGRLYRRTLLAALVVLVSLVYWNHEAWIARKNIERYALTGKLDVGHLTRDLSPNAIPAIVSLMPSIDEATRAEIRAAFERLHAGKRELAPDRWFEWNLGRAKARAALATLGILPALARSG